MLTRRTFLGLAAATVTLAIPGVADADRRRSREPRWGACPNGTYGANAATTLAKWPDSKAMRLFIPNGCGAARAPEHPGHLVVEQAAPPRNELRDPEDQGAD